MVDVHVGQFAMGTVDATHPEDMRHLVTVTRPFELMRTEVSQALYLDVMGTNPSAAGRRFGAGRDAGPCAPWGVGDALPVFCVSWLDAVEFCNALSARFGLAAAYEIETTPDGAVVTWRRAADGFRLPTEAEWGIAAARQAPASFDGVGESSICEHGNVRTAATDAAFPRERDLPSFTCVDPFDGLAPSARFPANPQGLHDMVGNVWEWTWDAWAPWTPASVIDPSHDVGRQRTARGGGWLSDRELTTPWARLRADMHTRGARLGFRVARTPSGP